MTESTFGAAEGASAVAPIERSLDLDLAWRPNRYVWGASWAFFCGLVAALPQALEPRRLPAVLLAWFLVVPLWGRIWVGLLDGRSVPSENALDRSARARLLAPLGRPASLGLMVLSFALAYTLEPSSLYPLVLSLLALMAVPILIGRRPRSQGWTRGLLEIWAPGLIAWLVAGGDRAFSADLRMATGNLADLVFWWQSAWPIPVMFFAFAAIYRGAIAVDPPGAAGRGRRWIVLGYLLGIATLALADSPRAAALIAMLFALQWPYQAALVAGKIRWHFHATQGLVMLAMLVASIGIAAAP